MTSKKKITCVGSTQSDTKAIKDDTFGTTANSSSTMQELSDFYNLKQKSVKDSDFHDFMTSKSGGGILADEQLNMDKKLKSIKVCQKKVVTKNNTLDGTCCSAVDKASQTNAAYFLLPKPPCTASDHAVDGSLSLFSACVSAQLLTGTPTNPAERDTSDVGNSRSKTLNDFDEISDMKNSRLSEVNTNTDSGRLPKIIPEMNAKLQSAPNELLCKDTSRRRTWSDQSHGQVYDALDLLVLSKHSSELQTLPVEILRAQIEQNTTTLNQLEKSIQLLLEEQHRRFQRMLAMHNIYSDNELMIRNKMMEEVASGTVESNGRSSTDYDVIPDNEDEDISGVEFSSDSSVIADKFACEKKATGQFSELNPLPRDQAYGSPSVSPSCKSNDSKCAVLEMPLQVGTNECADEKDSVTTYEDYKTCDEPVLPIGTPGYACNSLQPLYSFLEYPHTHQVVTVVNIKRKTLQLTKT